MKYSVWYLLLALFTDVALGYEKSPDLANNIKVDPFSHANVEEARVTNVSLELDINFEDQALNGSVTLSVERVHPEAQSVVSLHIGLTYFWSKRSTVNSKFQFLDSLDLSIHRVLEEPTGQQLDFVVGDSKKYVGSKLEVKLTLSNERLVDIRIYYTTSKNASGLVWLTKEQTAGKTHPYLFSKCQPYACRSLVPLQGWHFCVPYFKLFTRHFVSKCVQLRLKLEVREKLLFEGHASGKKSVHSQRTSLAVRE